MAVKKRPGSERDKRQDPDDTEAPTAADLRVDRVYSPVSRPRPRRTGSQAAVTASSARPAATRRTPTTAAADTEIALRHELLLLKRQLAAAQQELANRDAALAREVAKRTTMASANDALRDQLRALRARIDELSAERTRPVGAEPRLHNSALTVEELAHEIAFERELRTVAHARIAELRAELEAHQRMLSARRRTRSSKMAITDPNDPSGTPGR